MINGLIYILKNKKIFKVGTIDVFMKKRLITLVAGVTVLALTSCASLMDKESYKRVDESFGKDKIIYQNQTTKDKADLAISYRAARDGKNYDSLSMTEEYSYTHSLAGRDGFVTDFEATCALKHQRRLHLKESQSQTPVRRRTEIKAKKGKYERVLKKYEIPQDTLK